MIYFSPEEMAYAWSCVFGHRGSGYRDEQEALEAELSHECYGSAA